MKYSSQSDCNRASSSVNWCTVVYLLFYWLCWNKTWMSSGTVHFSVKISVDQDQWSHQCPHIEGDANPAGGDLHPHRWPLAGHGLIVGVRAAHNSETCQLKDLCFAAISLDSKIYKLQYFKTTTPCYFCSWSTKCKKWIRWIWSACVVITVGSNKSITRYCFWL